MSKYNHQTSNITPLIFLQIFKMILRPYTVTVYVVLKHHNFIFLLIIDHLGLQEGGVWVTVSVTVPQVGGAETVGDLVEGQVTFAVTSRLPGAP